MGFIIAFIGWAVLGTVIIGIIGFSVGAIQGIATWFRK